MTILKQTPDQQYAALLKAAKRAGFGSNVAAYLNFKFLQR